MEQSEKQAQAEQESTLLANDGHASLVEYVYNGRLIDWQYWVQSMPVLNPCDACRLMAALDPDLFAELTSRPVPQNNPSQACNEARRMERLALAEGLEGQAPDVWYRWALERGFSVHHGFFVAVRGRYLSENETLVLGNMPRLEASRWECARVIGAGKRQVRLNHFRYITDVSMTFPDFIEEVEERITRWWRGQYKLWEAAQVLADSAALDVKELAEQMDAAIRAGQLIYRVNNIRVDKQRITQEHLWNCIVFQEDVNGWLAQEAIRGELRLEYPYAEAPEVMFASASLETAGDGLESSCQDSGQVTVEFNIDTVGLNPLSLGAIAIEAAKSKAWDAEKQTTDRAKDVCKASAEVFLRECLSRLYMLLEGGAIAATNPVGGFPFLAGHDDPKSAGWLVTPEDKAKALAMLGVGPDACLAKQDEEDQGEQPNRARDSWNLVKPLKPQGYNMALYSVLKRAHDEGKSCPKPREVLERFREDKPACVTRVLPASFEYLSGEEIEERTVSLSALGEAIRRMTKKPRE
ncbi:MAG: hypothetical protein EPO09_07350 [Aquabacterium sp.]|uniref:hypothetical protein n=1 Tax=Aquabacterium sp. TaxID=1872578 RepID=UPI0011F6389E|nr:hypothetical protein [Aquabacterium sp.]TAK95776.1 MAG: hypothetical protein EPO09_07350 [Aquabacterium sp.]